MKVGNTPWMEFQYIIGYHADTLGKISVSSSSITFLGGERKLKNQRKPFWGKHENPNRHKPEIRTEPDCPKGK